MLPFSTKLNIFPIFLDCAGCYLLRGRSRASSFCSSKPRLNGCGLAHFRDRPIINILSRKAKYSSRCSGFSWKNFSLKQGGGVWARRPRNPSYFQYSIERKIYDHFVYFPLVFTRKPTNQPTTSARSGREKFQGFPRFFPRHFFSFSKNIY